MRDIFRSWLFVLILIAFLFTIALTYLTQRKQSEYQAGQEISRELLYFTEQIAEYAKRRETLRAEANRALLNKARLLALAIEQDPDLLIQPEALQSVADVLALNALYITDDTGVIRASIPRKYENVFDFHNYDTTRPYLGLITGELDQIVEEPRPNDDELATTGVIRYQQFAGVPRKDQRGIVQVAYSNEQYDNAIAAVSLENCAVGYTVRASGFLFLLDENGVISATTRDLLLDPPAFDEANVGGGSFSITYQGQRCLAQAIRSDGITLLAAVPYGEVYSDIGRVLLRITAFYSVTFASVYIQVSKLLDKVVVNNIDRTNAGLKRITSGNLDERINIMDNQEFRELSSGINATVDALKRSIAQAEDCIRAELALAKAIQTSALPGVFPQRREFSLYASMTPAKEVGGDFYDFFPIDTKHIALVIADVSGKGIPAALFMMKCKTLLKGLVESGISPAEALRQANNKLCEENEAEMFVTVWLGVFDIGTGHIACANAGHEYPTICRRGQGYELLKDKHGLALAVMENVEYQEYQIDLRAGDRLCVYTDGATEAINGDEALFSTSRLVAALNRTQALSVRQALESVRADIDAYAGSTPQFDDITLLLLEFSETQSVFTRRLTLKPEAKNMEQALTFMEDTLSAAGVSKKCATRFAIAVDELYSNIIRYSGATEARFICTIDGKTIELCLMDNGARFDPLASEPPDTTLGLEERAIGGLGLHIVKSSMQSVRYAYRDGWNLLTLTAEDADRHGKGESL